MLLAVLVDAAGGPSRLGGVVQRGFRIFRQVFQRERPPGSGVAPEQSLARLPQNQLSRVVHPTVSSNVFAVVRQGARGILDNYLARNQIHNLAAEMRRRYAVRLMSGSASIYPGLGNRLAIYGFVGIGFAGVVQNHAYQGQRNGCDPVENVVQDLFKETPEDKVIPETVLAADEETELLVVRRLSLSEESDITILDEGDAFEDDFEVIQDNELCLSTGPEAEAIWLSDVEVELRGLNDLQTQQNAELRCLIRKLSEDNALLKETLDVQTLEDNMLKRELCNTLKTVDAQQKELFMLRETVQDQNELLNTILSQTHSFRGKEVGSTKTPRDIEDTIQHAGDRVVYSEIDMERLRAEGGRVRGLKIHRKKRMKNV